PQTYASNLARLSTRNELSEHGVTAFPVQHFTRTQAALRRRHDIAAPAARHARRFATQANGRDADAELESDQVIGLVHRRVLAGVVGEQAVLLEAALDIGIASREGHVDAPAQVAEHRTAVALQAGDDLDLSPSMQAAAIGDGTK